MSLGTKRITWLLILLVWYYIMILVINPILINYLFNTNSIIAELFAQILSLCIPIIIIAMKKENQDSKTLLFCIEDNPIRTIEKKSIWLWIGIIISLSLGLQYLFSVIDVIYIINTKDYSIIDVIPEFDLLVFVFTILVMGIIPAIFEEICYRGMYFAVFKDNKILLFVLTNLIFASLHSSVLSFVNAFILGIVLMKCYSHTGTLKLVIILHLISNLLSIIFSNLVSLPFSPLSILENYANDKQMISILFFYFGIVGLMLTIGISFYLKLNIGKYKYEKKGLSKAFAIISIIMIVLSFSLFILKMI